jgi:PAP2 superfamily
VAHVSTCTHKEDKMKRHGPDVPPRSRTIAGIVPALLLTIGVATAAAAPELLAAAHPATIVVEWNQMAYDIGFAEDQFLTFKGARAHAMMHLAQHDALNAVHPVFEQYAFFGSDRRAHPVAGAAQAARDVLLSQYPNEQKRIDGLLASQLARLEDDPARTAGIVLGQQSAAAVLQAREGDGWDFQGTYRFGADPGDYQTTPPWNGFVLQPGFRFAKPFGLPSPDHLRPAPPPALATARYAKAYNEVKDVGRVDSTVRTADQTGYAVWWMEFAEGFQNRLARQLVIRNETRLWTAARLFATLNMGLFDSYLAVWDAKYAYDHWRPYTAIRAADNDGNTRTAPDPAWEPLRPTPPFPEYVSAHSAVCASSLEILRRAFGNRTPFTMDSTTAPPDMPTRSFTRFTTAAAECADSRVRLGFHFRYATDRGIKLGRDVAHHILTRHLRGWWSESWREGDRDQTRPSVEAGRAEPHGVVLDIGDELEGVAVE